MRLFSKPQDPLTARTKALDAEISRLEGEIASLARGKVATAIAVPTARPSPFSVRARAQRIATTSGRVPEPHVGLRPATPQRVAPHPQDPHFNDLGVRKYDLLSAWRRLTTHLAGPTSNNPKMVQYLAAGSIQGLRPLRYEKRIARNRFLALLALLVLVLWGLAYWSFKR